MSKPPDPVTVRNPFGRWACSVGLFAAALCLGGCLYDQPVAPGGAEAIDERLLGRWRCLFPGESDDPFVLTVTPEAGRHYRVESASDGESAMYDAYLVNFRSHRLLNVHVEDREPGEWALLRYTLYRPTLLHLEFADDKRLEEAATEQRTAALKRALKEGNLFQDYCTCVRVAHD